MSELDERMVWLRDFTGKLSAARDGAKDLDARYVLAMKAANARFILDKFEKWPNGQEVAA